MLRFLYTKKRDIKMQWKYVVLQYLVLDPGLALRVQSLVLAVALSLKSLLTSLVLSARARVSTCSYRLAPEALFPAAFEDCVKATKHFLTNAAKFRVDPQRIAVAGTWNSLPEHIRAEPDMRAFGKPLKTQLFNLAFK